ncbi:MAG TPA: hypothetical protein VJ909_00080, partial [Prolixibacteraceae bacterium]|nr:hypothetical protein [Prolixibacteraceae bacterium]
SDMDVVSRMKWVEYSKAKDEMFSYTDTKQSPWYVVDSDDKKKARLNCISHLLSLIPYDDYVPEKKELEPRPPVTGYVRTPIDEQTFIPDLYADVREES